MAQKTKTFFILVCLIIFLNVVVAAPPTFTTFTADKNILIETPITEPMLFNESYDFHLHAINSSDGTLLRNDTTWCFIHIYEPITGEHIIQSNMSFSGNNIDFYFFTLGTNFSKVGTYSVVFYCETIDGQLGGQIGNPVDITYNMPELTVEKSIIFMIIAVFLIVLLCLSVWGFWNAYAVEWFIGYICSSYVLLFCILFICWLLLSTYVSELVILSIIFWILWLVLAFGFLPFIAGIVLYLVVTGFNVENINKMMKMGYTHDEAKTLTSKNK